MTTEQAVKWLKDLNKGLAMPQYEDALDMAIQALQAQAEKTCDLEKSNFSKEQYKLDTDTAYECGYNAGFQARADCNTCDNAVRDRVGVIGCAKFDSKPTVDIPSDAKWIHTEECDEEWQYRCSKCNMPSRSNGHRYCSNCGAYMYGKRER